MAQAINQKAIIFKGGIVQPRKLLCVAIALFSIHFLTGCQPLAMGLEAAFLADGLLNSDENESETSKKVYTKNDFIKHHDYGNPDKVILIDKESEAEVWEYYNTPTKGKMEIFAFVGDEMKRDATGDMTKYSEDYLKRIYATLFPCYDYLQPTQGDSIAKIKNIMGTPEDEFLLKDEQGEVVPNSTIIWYFDTNNGQLTRTLMISTRNGIATKVEEWTGPQAMNTYKSYLVLCEQMAHRPVQIFKHNNLE